MSLWHESANCRGSEKADDLFDDDKDIRQDALKSLCSRCPVRFECLQEGLNLQERFGGRGGLDQDDLRETQHIDAFGRPLSSKITLTTCLFCQTEIELDGKKSQDVTCPNCNLQWRVLLK